MAELPGGTRLDAPQPGNVPAAETMQLLDHLLDDHHDADMQPADTDETGPQAGVKVVPITVEQLFAAAKQYQSEHATPTLPEIRWVQWYEVHTLTALLLLAATYDANSTTPSACRLHAVSRPDAGRLESQAVQQYGWRSPPGSRRVLHNKVHGAQHNSVAVLTAVLPSTCTYISLNTYP
jgi:hypothetical protein